MLVGAKRAFSAGDLSHEIIKAVPKVHSVLGPGLLVPVHKAQLRSYLRMSNKSLGLLINFNVMHLKEGIHRVVNGHDWRSPS
jgi:PD-(D/E)XK nuclease superfamily